MSAIRSTLALVASALIAAGAAAQEFPSKPVKIVVNFAVGGPLDLMARTFAQQLGERTKQTVIVENTPGAGGNLGAQAVARAPADGHTLLFTAENAITVSPLVYPRMGFDPRKDLEPVSLVGAFEQALVVHPGKGIRTLDDLIERGKAGQLTYASAGNGSPGHLAFLAFGRRAGMQPTHIPYKGNAPAVVDLLAGQVDAGFVVVGGVRPHVQSGKLMALAVSGKERRPDLPQVPTIAESGFADFSIAYGYLIMLPKGAPDAVKHYWQTQLQVMLRTPSVVERLKELDTRVINGDAAAARTWLDESATRWSAALKDSGIRLE